MTEVLSITQQEGNTHFGSPLQHSSSQSSLLLHASSSYSRSCSDLKARYASVGYDTRLPVSLPSSAPSSPRLTAPQCSTQPSYTSTPSSSLSLDEHCHHEEKDIVFPSYDDGGYFNEIDEEATPSSPDPSDFDAGTPSRADDSLVTASCPETSEPQQKAGDDTAIRCEPTRHVDYLSHSWKEEDGWASWRHIVAKRKVYNNSPRLENALWRTWAKSKYRLKTVSPEALNWYALIIALIRQVQYTKISQDERSRRNMALWASSNGKAGHELHSPSQPALKK